ncbi:hypothetical protein TNCV_1120881 [Trichonephila clavipes]|uniref:Uncharacterized protein n=1 Tax=Trichonephila clavipes TaxID=2585209 RepID=A0A8X6VNY6_TRICX|nr:hypothetical protein TNCV_1120881 [Trichonephila clavipes]
MSTHTKYVGERPNIVLNACTFGLTPVYVDNHRYALVEVEKRGADKEATGCFPPNPLFCWESLRPFKTKRAEEEAYPVLSIFLTFGVPAILQSANKSQILKPKSISRKLPIPLETEEQHEETGNASGKNLSGDHTENHISKNNIEEDLQSTTSSHQVLAEKHKLIFLKKRAAVKYNLLLQETKMESHEKNLLLLKLVVLNENKSLMSTMVVLITKMCQRLLLE